ncbi:sulfite exporter TauE/SafE family protein [Thiotrichales bacterium 19X7-9]|nr:sulfite exporter TauE/SafE family protein [Thiotrichales bacterium 19X7-9]
MLLEIALIFVITGIVVGILSGLFGLGGGLTIVPVMSVYLELTHVVGTEYTMHIAIATSLFVMIFTSLASTFSHHKKGNIHWQVAWPLGIGVLIGAVIGAIIAHLLNSEFLKIIFIIFLVYTIAKWILKTVKKPIKNSENLTLVIPKTIILNAYGCASGFVAVILGIGCSVMAVPFLRHYKFSMPQSAAIAAAITPALAAVGATVYIILGYTSASLPHSMLGFVYLPATIGLIIGSFCGVPIGTWVSNKMPEKIQSIIYLLFLLLILIVMLS